MPVLIFSVAVLALPAAPPVPVLMTVPVDGSLTRRIVRLWMVAATLFSVMTRGRLMTLALPCCSRAVKRAASAFAPSSEPSTRSRDDPLPAPKPPKPLLTGKSNMKGTGERATLLLATGAEPSFSPRSEEHTSELQSHVNLVCRLLLEKKKL